MEEAMHGTDHSDTRSVLLTGSPFGDALIEAIADHTASEDSEWFNIVLTLAGSQLVAELEHYLYGVSLDEALPWLSETPTSASPAPLSSAELERLGEFLAEHHLV
jgi:hypothetical protein